MKKGLKDYFPQIRTREEVLQAIQSNLICAQQFSFWDDEQKEEFLGFCTGVRGVKMTYDSFFKELMNPEIHPERLEELLSLLLEQKVHIKQILPNDSVRIADESTLLITDIVVELEGGNLANIEIQKIGYAFPGQRGACYSADLLLRQYKRVRGQKKKKFTYQDMKTVYTIVFFEKSTTEFHAIEEYIHKARQVFNTGLTLNMLQEYILIPLDIFQKSKNNKNIENKLEAWLSFMIDDSPERIMELIEKYPSFREMYGEVYEICRNVEGVMNMFSKELQEIDRNTVQYMIEEQQEQIDAMEKEKEELEKEKEELEKQNREQLAKLREEKERLDAVERENADMRKELEELKLLINKLGNAEK